jgi:hypothetical protein
MPEDYLTKREFDRLTEQVTHVSIKLDTLVNGRIEEARMMGELTGMVKQVIERIDSQEEVTGELRKRQDDEAKMLRGEIDALWEQNRLRADGKIKWWNQLIVVLVAAVVAAYLGKIWK